MYPSLPERTFDRQAYIASIKTEDAEYEQKFMNSEYVIHSDGSVYVIDVETFIPRDVADIFMTHGPWDDPTYTQRERTLAWHLYCEQTKPPASGGNCRARVYWTLCEKSDLLKNFNEWLMNTSKTHQRTPNAIQSMILKLLEVHKIY